VSRKSGEDSSRGLCPQRQLKQDGDWKLLDLSTGREFGIKRWNPKMWGLKRKRGR
jgi:hypothetical protein